MGPMILPDSILHAPPHTTGITAGLLGGLLAGGAVLLALRGILHLRLRPTVLPISEAPAIRLATLLLSLSSGALGKTRGWALQFALGIIGMAGGRYVTY